MRAATRSSARLSPAFAPSSPMSWRSTPPDIEQPSSADSLVDGEDGPSIPRPRKKGRVSPAAMGTDVGGRFRVGVVRVGTAARRHRRRRHFRHLARTAICRQRRGAADADGRGRRPTAARSRRTRSADLGARVGSSCGRRRHPDERRGAPHPREGRPRDRRHAHIGRRAAGEGGRIERRSSADAARVDRSGGARAGISRARPQLSSGRHRGQDQPRVERASEFHGADGRYARAGRLHSHRPRARLSRARVRCVEIRNVVAAPVPGRHHSIVDRSRARAGRRTRDVDYRAIRTVPPSQHKLGRCVRGVRRRSDRHARSVRARPEVVDSAPTGDHAGRSGITVRSDGRSHLSWRAGARSALHDASAARLGAISHADPRACTCAAQAHIPVTACPDCRD